MKIGIPRGLLYDQFHPFFNHFFLELGAELVISPPTNKSILDDGVKYCIDEACLPVKVFHGHVAAVRDKCDALLIPRIMQLYKGEFICPKFCGLPEMVKSSIPEMPPIISQPIYATSEKRLYRWALDAGGYVTRDRSAIKKAFHLAISKQRLHTTGINDQGYAIKIALAGHPYNLYDDFINKNVKNKLNKLGVGVMTEETVDRALIDQGIEALYKKPFWTFARKTYGFLAHAAESNAVNGIVYISSFACGIDSVIVELIRDRIGDFPFMVLKMDEHTGEAGMDTRIEAFVDMLERSKPIETDYSSHGKCLSGGEGSV